MKRRIANTILGAGLLGCFILTMVTDGLAALAPLLGGVILAVALADYNTDYVRRY